MTLRRSMLALAGAVLTLGPSPLPAAISTFDQQVVIQASISGPEVDDAFGQHLDTGDFDGDGYADLAIGTPSESFADVLNSGSVSVHYGGPGGLGSEIDGFVQSSGSIPGDAAIANQFGLAVAAGDFDSDGYSDLAIGSFTDVGDVVQAGTVTVLFGAPGGLNDLGGAQEWSQASSGVPGSPAASDFWGSRLAVGDFDDDGHDDLAVGAPSDTGPMTDTGSVTVLYGAPTGLSSTGVDFLTGASFSCSAVQAEEKFGAAIAAGDFDADGDDDLAIGVPEEGEFPGGVTVGAAGMVYAVPGSSTGLVVAGAHCIWAGATLDGATVPGTRQAGGRFGESLAAGNFNRNTATGALYEDLAIGHPLANESGVNDGGEVILLPGTGLGLSAQNSAALDTTDLPGMPVPEAGQRFGVALYALRASGSSSHDLLAALVPGGNPDSGGGVVLLPGSAGGLILSKARLLRSADADLQIGPAEPSDHFGRYAAAADFDDDGYRDLAIGSPYKDVNGESNAGAILVLYGVMFADGFESGDRRFWSEASP